LHFTNIYPGHSHISPPPLEKKFGPLLLMKNVFHYRESPEGEQGQREALRKGESSSSSGRVSISGSDTFPRRRCVVVWLHTTTPILFMCPAVKRGVGEESGGGISHVTNGIGGKRERESHTRFLLCREKAIYFFFVLPFSGN